jgi:hypothetical protein
MGSGAGAGPGAPVNAPRAPGRRMGRRPGTKVVPRSPSALWARGALFVRSQGWAPGSRGEAAWAGSATGGGGGEKGRDPEPRSIGAGRWAGRPLRTLGGQVPPSPGNLCQNVPYRGEPLGSFPTTGAAVPPGSPGGQGGRVGGSAAFGTPAWREGPWMDPTEVPEDLGPRGGRARRAEAGPGRGPQLRRGVPACAAPRRRLSPPVACAPRGANPGPKGAKAWWGGRCGRPSHRLVHMLPNQAPIGNAG